VKKQIELRSLIILFVGISFIFYLFPSSYVNAVKFQSGVTITAPSGTTPPPAGGCQDANGDGINDATGGPCQPTAGPGTSAEQKVSIKNDGTSPTPAKVMIKGGNWVSDSAVAGTPAAPAGTTGTGSTISGPEVTRASITQGDINNKKPLNLNAVEFGSLTGGQTIPVYFQLLTWVNAPSGSFHHC
jgi:hypothetical protein